MYFCTHIQCKVRRTISFKNDRLLNSEEKHIKQTKQTFSIHKYINLMPLFVI